MNDAAADAAAAEAAAQSAVANLAGGDEAAERIINRIGQLTRTLRESMRELGLDKQVEKAAVAMTGRSVSIRRAISSRTRGRT